MAANTETVRIDTVKKSLWDRIEALGKNISGETLDALLEMIESGGGVVYVPFAVTIDKQGTHATTTADFDDVVSAIADGKNILAKVYMLGMVFCVGLTTFYPDTEPELLGFCGVENMADPGETPEPQLLKITWSAESAAAEIVNLAVAT